MWGINNQNYETHGMSCVTYLSFISNHMFASFLFELFVYLAENFKIHYIDTIHYYSLYLKHFHIIIMYLY